jgi:hypothetical protein
MFYTFTANIQFAHIMFLTGKLCIALYIDLMNIQYVKYYKYI